jgi:hypothetical protein
VNERLNPKARDQIQALRTANRFTPQAAIAGREVEGEDDADSWELPTAVSGLIQLPDDIAREAAPSAVRPQPGPVPTIDLSGNDTQPSMAPRRSAEVTVNRESTKLSNDVRAVREELHQGSSKRTGRTRQRSESVNVISSGSSGGNTGNSTGSSVISSTTGNGSSAEDRKRQIMLAAAVVILVVLSFFAGRL